MKSLTAKPAWKEKAREDFESLLERLSVADAASQDRFAENLNQDLRRLRRTTSIGAAAQVGTEVCAPFASRAAVFLFRDGMAESEYARGLGATPVQFRPDEGGAFRAAIESGDPVVASATPAEISEVLAERAGGETADRVYLFPVAVRGEVTAMVFASGAVQPAPLELVAGILAMHLEALTPPATAQRGDLVSIAGTAAPGASGKPVRAQWADLSAADQALHLRAQRLARLRVAEMRLEHPESVRRGREQGSLYATLREPIERARDQFRSEFVAASPSMVDYLYLELVRGLADGNDRLLGPDFPGPLV